MINHLNTFADVNIYDAIRVNKWYRSDVKRPYYSRSGKKMKLWKALDNEQAESEVTVFRKFVPKMMIIQNQPDGT